MAHKSPKIITVDWPNSQRQSDKLTIGQIGLTLWLGSIRSHVLHCQSQSWGKSSFRISQWWPQRAHGINGDLSVSAFTWQQRWSAMLRQRYRSKRRFDKKIYPEVQPLNEAASCPESDTKGAASPWLYHNLHQLPWSFQETIKPNQALTHNT